MKRALTILAVLFVSCLLCWAGVYAVRYPQAPILKHIKWGDCSVEMEYGGNEKGELSLYELGPESEFGEGAIEFDLKLNSVPTTNKFPFKVESENVNFYHQPALNSPDMDHTPGVVRTTETQTFDSEGNVVDHRPEHVIDSYALYRSDGKKGFGYQTGKLAHIYRPKIYDANGDWVWGDLELEERGGFVAWLKRQLGLYDKEHILTVSVDKEWLRNATYPVIIDPTLGTTDDGATAYSCNIIIFSTLVNVTDSATGIEVATIHWQSSTTTETPDIKFGLYEYTDADPAGDDRLTTTTSISDDEGYARLSSSSANRWRYVYSTFESPTNLTSGENYWLSMAVNSSGATVYYDTSSDQCSNNNCACYYNHFNWSMSDPHVGTSGNLPRELAVYMNYGPDRTFYVDKTNGDDSTAVEGDLNSPFEYVPGMASYTGSVDYLPGDTWIFQDDEEWSEGIKIDARCNNEWSWDSDDTVTCDDGNRHRKGVLGQEITFERSGDGTDKPIIKSSVTALANADWTNWYGDVWYADIDDPDWVGWVFSDPASPYNESGAYQDGNELTYRPWIIYVDTFENDGSFRTLKNDWSDLFTNDQGDNWSWTGSAPWINVYYGPNTSHPTDWVDGNKYGKGEYVYYSSSHGVRSKIQDNYTEPPLSGSDSNWDDCGSSCSGGLLPKCVPLPVFGHPHAAASLEEASTLYQDIELPDDSYIFITYAIRGASSGNYVRIIEDPSGDDYYLTDSRTGNAYETWSTSSSDLTSSYWIGDGTNYLKTKHNVFKTRNTGSGGSTYRILWGTSGTDIYIHTVRVNQFDFADAGRDEFFAIRTMDQNGECSVSQKVRIVVNWPSGDAPADNEIWYQDQSAAIDFLGGVEYWNIDGLETWGGINFKEWTTNVPTSCPDGDIDGGFEIKNCYITLSGGAGEGLGYAAGLGTTDQEEKVALTGGGIVVKRMREGEVESPGTYGYGNFNIESNEISKGLEYGIRLYNAGGDGAGETGGTVHKNYVHNCCQGQVGWPGQIYGSHSNKNSIYENLVKDGGSNGYTQNVSKKRALDYGTYKAGGGQGIWFDVECDENDIQRNRVENVSGVGLFSEVNQDGLWSGNVVINTNSGMQFGGMQLRGVDNITVTNNTIIDSHFVGIEMTKSAADASSLAKNNIISPASGWFIGTADTWDGAQTLEDNLYDEVCLRYYTFDGDPANDTSTAYAVEDEFGIDADFYEADIYNGATLRIVTGTDADSTYTIDDSTTSSLDCEGDNLYNAGVRDGDEFEIVCDDDSGKVFVSEYTGGAETTHTFNGWCSAEGEQNTGDTASFYADPEFVDRDNDNVTLETTSPARDEGQDVSSIDSSLDDVLMHISVWPDSVFTVKMSVAPPWDIGAYCMYWTLIDEGFEEIGGEEDWLGYLMLDWYADDYWLDDVVGM